MKSSLNISYNILNCLKSLVIKFKFKPKKSDFQYITDQRIDDKIELIQKRDQDIIEIQKDLIPKELYEETS